MEDILGKVNKSFDKVLLGKVNKSFDEVLDIIRDLGTIKYPTQNWEGLVDSTDSCFIWLAVDSNGNEKMTPCEKGFQRFSPKLYHSKYSIDPKIRKASLEEQKKICSYNDTQMRDDHWIEIPNEGDISKFGAPPSWAYLPKGTIKKLIGRELTWEDEPVKYEG